MTLKRSFSGFVTVFLILVAFTYAETEKKRVLELAPSALLEVDILQSLADDDKSGSAEIGRLEMGVEAVIGQKVEAGLFLELGDNDIIGLLETWFTFKPVEVLSLTAGQLTMPFGEYATELQTDPLVMCGYENDSIAIPGAETISPGFITGVEIKGFSASIAVYNASYSERLEAFAVKMGYSFKEIVSAGVSTRLESVSKIDFDVNLSLTPGDFLAIIGEFYTGLKNGESGDKHMGIHSEIDIMPINPLVIAARFGWMVDSKDKNFGTMQVAGCAKYSANEHVTFGLEVNSNNAILNAEAQGFDNIGVRIGCCVE